MVIGLNDEVFEVNGSLFVSLNFFLDFAHPGEFGLFSEFLGFQFIFELSDFLVLKSLELPFAGTDLISDSTIVNLILFL